MSDMITVQGTIDLHIHSHPCLFPRIGDDETIVAAAANAGMRGVLLKCHHESSVSRAYLVNARFPEIDVFGGIVLNRYVGGLNPESVEAALRLGGKAVWMPTIDSANHARTFGSTGGYGVQSGGVASESGICILQDGALKPAVQEIVRLVIEHDAFLGTGHLSPEEILIVVREASRMGLGKTVINHPFFKVPNLSREQLRELVGWGATAEIEYCGISPMWAWEGTNLARMRQAIAELGADNCVMVTDGGQRHNPMPVESFRILAQCLYERGVTRDELHTMMVVKPKFLLGLS